MLSPKKFVFSLFFVLGFYERFSIFGLLKGVLRPHLVRQVFLILRVVVIGLLPPRMTSISQVNTLGLYYGIFVPD